MTRLLVFQVLSVTLLYVLIGWHGWQLYKVHRVRRRMDALEVELDILCLRYTQLSQRWSGVLGRPLQPPVARRRHLQGD
jgi:hypothetical protein